MATRTAASAPAVEALPGLARPGQGQQAPRRSIFDGPVSLLEQIAEMMILTGKTIVACITPPYSWTDEFIEEAWLLVRRTFIPVVISTTFFGFGAPGLQASNLLSIFGTVDREGAFFVMASVREFAPWINGMVLAGVGGTDRLPTSVNRSANISSGNNSKHCRCNRP